MSLSLDRSLLKPVATVVAIVLSLFQIYFTGGFGVTDAHILRGTHLTLIMILVLLLVPSRKLAPGEKEGWFPILIDLALIALAIAINVYVFQEADNISRRLKYVEDVTNLDLFYGTGLVLLVLEATRRTSGWPLVIVSGSFLAYAMFGEYMPGGLAHNGIEYDRLIEQLFLLTDGIYGVPLGAAAGMIFAFVMFGAFLESSKMSSLFMDLACLLTRKSAGGPAKVSIFASALFGTISGSAAANVYGTGTFTIPLMKKVGYTPHFAGAVEAVASTGGQMMPPIMGAAAFIMADVIGVSYLTIAKAALIPSVLYYLTLLAIIHLEAVSKNMGTLPPELVPSAASVLRRLYYLFPLVFLITILLMGRSVIACAYYGTVCIVILSMIRSETRFTFKRLCGALELSAKNAMMVSSCCACAGIIIGVISLTGIGYKFINVITALAGSNLLLLMAMLMVTCIILGMGVPTAPAYIIVATLGAPALMKAGVPIIAAHMFVYFYAILSVITPPGLRGGRHRGNQRYEDRGDSHEAGHRGLHHPLHVRVRARPAHAGFHDRDRHGLRFSPHRRHRHSLRDAKLAPRPLPPLGTCTLARQRAHAHLPRPHHGYHRPFQPPYSLVRTAPQKGRFPRRGRLTVPE